MMLCAQYNIIYYVWNKYLYIPNVVDAAHPCTGQGVRESGDYKKIIIITTRCKYVVYDCRGRDIIMRIV